MAFTFDGIFSTAGAELLPVLLAAHPGATGRAVTQPFDGIAVRLAAPPAEGWAVFADIALPALAARGPDAAWVYVHAAPLDGRTHFAGAAWRGPARLCRRTLEDTFLTDAAGAPLMRQRSLTGKPLPAAELPADFPHGLAALLAPLGVRLRTGYFAPFSLRFWEAS